MYIQYNLKYKALEPRGRALFLSGVDLASGVTGYEIQNRGESQHR